jgi:hypothetical protein
MGDKLEEKSLSFLRRALFYASLVAVAVASGAWYGSDALGAQEIHESKMVHSEGQRLTAVKVRLGFSVDHYRSLKAC